MEEIKVFAPVLIPTLCRYEHFKRCVESLARCTHADQTELVIGVDYPAKEEHWEGYRKIDAYVDTITGFKKVTIMRTDHNLGFGPNGNYARLYYYVKGKYDRWIFTEDDNEFAPSFLDFMNKALELYKDDPRVSSVCGFNQYESDNHKIVFIYDSSAWGKGQWFNRPVPPKDIAKTTVQSFKKTLKITRYYPALTMSVFNMIRKNTLYGDSRRSCYNILNEHFQVRPAHTLVKNWGLDGSGVHGGNSYRFNSMSLPEEKVFDFAREEPVRTKDIDRQVRRNMMPKSCIKRLKTYVKIVIDYLSIRIKLK